MTSNLASTLRRSINEPSAFTEVYAARAEGVFLFLVRRTFDVETARDLTAETFAQAFENRGRFRGDEDAAAEAWLFGIARHVLSRYIRKGSAERRAAQRLGIRLSPISDDDYDRVMELAELADLRDCVANALRTLGNRERDALSLRVVNELPYPQVAEALGVSEPAARARVSRGLHRLAEAVERSFSRKAPQ